MAAIPMSQKGQELLKLYKDMADKGYNKTAGSFVPVAYADFGLSGYKQVIKPVLE